MLYYLGWFYFPFVILLRGAIGHCTGALNFSDYIFTYCGNIREFKIQLLCLLGFSTCLFALMCTILIVGVVRAVKNIVAVKFKIQNFVTDVLV